MRIPIRRAVGGVVACLLALVGTGLVGGTAYATSGSSFVSLINSSRHSAGLASYAVRSDLTAVAQAQAQRMASSGRLYHNPSLATAVTHYSWVGENVGYGPSVLALHQAFMASAGHRANIMDHMFTEVGVGVVQVGSTIWVSEVFRRPSGTVSASPKPAVRPKPKPVVRTSSRPKALPRRTVSTARAAARKPLAPRLTMTAAGLLPPHVQCAANAGVAERIRDLAGAARSARVLDQTQQSLLGFQCGAHLPLTGVFDPGTLQSLGQ